jgi:hypothetical protein
MKDERIIESLALSGYLVTQKIGVMAVYSIIL